VTAIDAQALLAAAPVHALTVFAVFARLGAMMMTAPALGDLMVSARVRLSLALAASLALAPAAAGHYPALSGAPAPLAAMVFGEIVIGAFIGLSARAVAAAMATAGQIASLKMGLSLAQIFDPNQQGQGALVGGFLSLLGATLIFAADLHHVLIGAVLDSYGAFRPGAALVAGSLAEAMIDSVAQGVSLGVRLAAPFIVFGLVFYAGAGVLNRLMPQAQVFFMLMPANLILGLALLMLSVGAIGAAFLNAFAAHLSAFGG
jgi:flagellar biosynthetic protein FliR